MDDVFIQEIMAQLADIRLKIEAHITSASSAPYMIREQKTPPLPASPPSSPEAEEEEEEEEKSDESMLSSIEAMVEEEGLPPPLPIGTAPTSEPMAVEEEREERVEEEEEREEEEEEKDEVPGKKSLYKHHFWPSPRAKNFAKAMGMNCRSHVAALKSLASHAGITVEKLLETNPLTYEAQIMDPIVAPLDWESCKPLLAAALEAKSKITMRRQGNSGTFHWY